MTIFFLIKLLNALVKGDHIKQKLNIKVLSQEFQSKSYSDLLQPNLTLPLYVDEGSKYSDIKTIIMELLFGIVMITD